MFMGIMVTEAKINHDSAELILNLTKIRIWRYSEKKKAKVKTN